MQLTAMQRPYGSARQHGHRRLTFAPSCVLARFVGERLLKAAETVSKIRNGFLTRLAQVLRELVDGVTVVIGRRAARRRTRTQNNSRRGCPDFRGG